MKVTRKYNQFRRDCYADLECEGCGHETTYTNAYDDDCFWNNVAPNFKCDQCGKSTKDLGLEPQYIRTKYKPWEIV